MTAATDFRSTLTGLREAARSFYGQGVATFHPVTVRPSLAFALVPRPREREDADPDRPRRTYGPRPRRSQIGRLCRLMAAAGPAGPAGLVDGGESDSTTGKPSRRNGFAGLTGYGARMLEDFCALTRQDKACYGIWTVTLPPESAAALDAIPDGAQQFGDRLRRTFGQALARAAAAESGRVRFPVPAHWAFVIEPQQSGRPHWHFVFRSKARRGRRWLLGKARLDRLIRGALVATGCPPVSVAAAGNVQALRRDPGSYLSKYLRKGRGVSPAGTIRAHGWSDNLIPHQWWGISRCARAWVREHCWELPRIVVNWLSLHWPELAAAGILRARAWQPDAPGAPGIVVGRWRGPEQLLQTLDLMTSWAESVTLRAA